MMTPKETGWDGRLAVMDDDPLFSDAIKTSFSIYVPNAEVTEFDTADPLFQEHVINPFDAVLWDYSGNFGLDKQEAAKKFIDINPAGVFLLTSGHFSPVNASNMVIPKPINDVPHEIMKRILTLSSKHPLARQVLYTTVFSCLQGVLNG